MGFLTLSLRVPVIQTKQYLFLFFKEYISAFEDQFR